MYAQASGDNGSLNGPLSGSFGLGTSGVRPLSPFLNIDPNAIRGSQPEFIFPEGKIKSSSSRVALIIEFSLGASRQRGRFELAFSQIGGSCMVGAAIGGSSGLYNGLRRSVLAGETGKLRRTQVID